VNAPDANIIKLPNISASVPQLKGAIKELQSQGYPLPDYPETPQNETEQSIKSRYDQVKGSAVNPVLREGNSDRRAPRAVKEYARQNPHKMGSWNPQSKSHVATMQAGDFRANEKSLTINQPIDVSVVLHKNDGSKQVLKEKISLKKGEIVDATFMSKQALCDFLLYQVIDAREKNILFSLHMKATMMKVSDPIIFGHAVKIFFKDLFEKHESTFEKLGVNVNNGFGDVTSKIASLPEEEKSKIEKEIEAILNQGPGLAMVNSEKGITNLHVPSDVIIDASMPAMIRTSGQMWDKQGKLMDTKAVIPDSSYAGIYQATIDFCKQNGAFDPATMGSVSNIGLMAQKAEEYGSHDKTFEIGADGIVHVIDQNGNVIIEHKVEKGDIWRMCQVKDEPVKDWVKLAVQRAKETNTPAVFWLDANRSHDAQLISKVHSYLKDHDTSGLEIHILSPEQAAWLSMKRLKDGKDTISVTGNVLRDYLTDLFPILEVGTSAKMLSIVPLMNGGGLFETGAGGSAPKHVQQLLDENHLRWDSLGEFLALAVSLELYSQQNNNKKAKILATTLDQATTQYLLTDKSPSRKTGEPDNRTSHFYLAMFWAQSLASQTDDEELSRFFAPFAEQLSNNENEIAHHFNAIQGVSVDIGGYYHPDEAKTEAVMRPVELFNEIIRNIAKG
jgi:isocitrate dehydrogenase